MKAELEQKQRESDQLTADNLALRARVQELEARVGADDEAARHIAELEAHTLAHERLMQQMQERVAELDGFKREITIKMSCSDMAGMKQNQMQLYGLIGQRLNDILKQLTSLIKTIEAEEVGTAETGPGLTETVAKLWRQFDEMLARTHMNHDDATNEGFRCPMTKEVFRDPVVLRDGITYERDAATKHFKRCVKLIVDPVTNRSRRVVTYTSPLSGANLADDFMVSNQTIKSMIGEIIDQKMAALKKEHEDIIRGVEVQITQAKETRERLARKRNREAAKQQYKKVRRKFRTTASAAVKVEYKQANYVTRWNMGWRYGDSDWSETEEADEKFLAEQEARQLAERMAARVQASLAAEAAGEESIMDVSSPDYPYEIDEHPGDGQADLFVMVAAGPSAAAGARD